MTKLDSMPLLQRVTTRARMGSDGTRGLYAAARRLLAPATTARRTLAARRASPTNGLTIQAARGFAVYGPDRFPEAPEIVELATKRLAEIDPEEIRKRGKPFMVPILEQATLTRDSPLVRVALRDDVLRAVTDYLRVVPILASIDLYYSRAVDREPISSQLLHCDGDDTRQVKIFVLCTPVDEASGPLEILDAETSEMLRRSLGYEYRSRVTDDQAREALGELHLTPLVGEPGTTCVVDTSRCFHYGSRIESSDDARLVAMIQYLTPFSFMLPRDFRRAAPYRHLAHGDSGELERLVLGAS